MREMQVQIVGSAPGLYSGTYHAGRESFPDGWLSIHDLTPILPLLEQAMSRSS